MRVRKRRACGNTSKQFFPVAIRKSLSGTICFICTGSTDVSHLSFSFGVGCDSLVQRWGVVIPQSSRALFCPFQMGYWGFVTLEPWVSHYRVPSQRTPPRGRCKCTFFTPSWARWASRLIGPWANWMAWAIVATVGGRLDDGSFEFFSYGGAMVLCAGFPTALARGNPGSSTPNQQIQGRPRLHWELALPPAGRAQTLVSQEPSRCLFPFNPFSVEYLFGQKTLKT